MTSPRLSFGIKTVPAHTGYDDILRVWREADAIDAIDHAWLWDHMLPPFGPADGAVLEGWTLLAALAAQTGRLGLGVLVTGNLLRPPAVLAKIAATTDAISHGRLTMGIGVGGTRTRPRPGRGPGRKAALDEYAACGLALTRHSEGVARLDEACTLLRRLWTEEVVDFSGRYYQVRRARCAPRPARRPPLLVGGWGTATLRVVARHADVWNVPGPPHHDLAFLRERARVLDAHCAAAGRDPGEITRSVQTHASYDDPAATRAVVYELIDAGFTHIVLSLPMPFPPAAARWAAEEIIAPVRERRAPAAQPSQQGLSGGVRA